MRTSSSNPLAVLCARGDATQARAAVDVTCCGTLNSPPTEERNWIENEDGINVQFILDLLADDGDDILDAPSVRQKEGCEIETDDESLFSLLGCLDPESFTDDNWPCDSADCSYDLLLPAQNDFVENFITESHSSDAEEEIVIQDLDNSHHRTSANILARKREEIASVPDTTEDLKQALKEAFLISDNGYEDLELGFSANEIFSNMPTPENETVSNCDFPLHSTPKKNKREEIMNNTDTNVDLRQALKEAMLISNNVYADSLGNSSNCCFPYMQRTETETASNRLLPIDNSFKKNNSGLEQHTRETTAPRFCHPHSPRSCQCLPLLDHTPDGPIALSPEDNSTPPSLPRTARVPVTANKLHPCASREASAPSTEQLPDSNCYLPFVPENCREIGAPSSELPAKPRDGVRKRSADRKENPEKVLLCTICEASFTGKRLLQQHLAEHKGLEPFSCIICGSRFWQQHLLMRHELKHISDDTLSCIPCGLKFKFRCDLQRHMHLHSGKKDIVCPVCDHAFATEAYLKRHMLRHRGVKSYICTICKAAFSMKYYLYQHMRIHSDKKFACGECESKFRSKQALRAHAMSHMNRSQFVCELCDMTFSLESEFNTHLSTHAHVKEKPYPCDICCARFETKKKRNSHKLMHAEKGKYVCKICKAAYKYKSSLNLHMRKHDEHKPHSCPICTASFNRKHRLDLHMLTHGNETQFSCDFCMAKFKYKDSLRRHINLQHKASGAF